MERYRRKFSISTLLLPKQHYFHQESFSRETNTLLKGFTATALTPLLGGSGLAIQLDHNLSIRNYIQASFSSPLLGNFKGLCL